MSSEYWIHISICNSYFMCYCRQNSELCLQTRMNHFSEMKSRGKIKIPAFRKIIKFMKIWKMFVWKGDEGNCSFIYVYEHFCEQAHSAFQQLFKWWQSNMLPFILLMLPKRHAAVFSLGIIFRIIVGNLFSKSIPTVVSYKGT